MVADDILFCGNVNLGTWRAANRGRPYEQELFFGFFFVTLGTPPVVLTTDRFFLGKNNRSSLWVCWGVCAARSVALGETMLAVDACSFRGVRSFCVIERLNFGAYVALPLGD